MGEVRGTPAASFRPLRMCPAPPAPCWGNMYETVPTREARRTRSVQGSCSGAVPRDSLCLHGQPPRFQTPGGKARVQRKPLDVQNLRHSQPPRSVWGMAEARTKSKAPDASQRGALHTGLPVLPFCHTLSLRLYVEQHVPLAVAAHSRRQPAQGHLPHRQKLCVRHPDFAAHLAST